MTRVGVRELRQNASRYVQMVKAGETVEITERGELVALLVAPGPSLARRDRLIGTGRLIRATGSTGRLRSGRSLPIRTGEPSNADLLAVERAERL
ncbi:MAG: type II toxin-antitoxin system Phd/YefM family antitoxin [Sporichthyaceae bacterium]